MLSSVDHQQLANHIAQRLAEKPHNPPPPPNWSFLRGGLERRTEASGETRVFKKPTTQRQQKTHTTHIFLWGYLLGVEVEGDSVLHVKEEKTQGNRSSV